MSNYPEILNNRMPYDIDGTVLFLWTSATNMVIPNSTQLRNINSENNTSNISINHSHMPFEIVIIFPELRYVKEYFLNINTLPTSIQYSMDTTTGLDGNWAVIDQEEIYVSSNTFLNFRNSNAITMNSNNPIKAIKFTGEGSNISIKNIHIYGFKALASDRIEFWHPTLDEALSPNYLNFGDVYRGGNEIRSFRLKNISQNKTANQIEIIAEALTVISPTLNSQFTFALENTNYSSSISINSISSNTISNDIIYIKRNTQENANTGPYTLRIKATPAAWIEL